MWAVTLPQLAQQSAGNRATGAKRNSANQALDRRKFLRMVRQACPVLHGLASAGVAYPLHCRPAVSLLKILRHLSGNTQRRIAAIVTMHACAAENSNSQVGFNADLGGIAGYQPPAISNDVILQPQDDLEHCVRLLRCGPSHRTFAAFAKPNTQRTCQMRDELRFCCGGPKVC